MSFLLYDEFFINWISLFLCLGLKLIISCDKTASCSLLFPFSLLGLFHCRDFYFGVWVGGNFHWMYLSGESYGCFLDALVCWRSTQGKLIGLRIAVLMWDFFHPETSRLRWSAMPDCSRLQILCFGS